MMFGFNQGLFGLAAVICAALYGVKHEARQAEKGLGVLSVAIAEERQALRLLQAEWAMRTEPDRLQKLADQHLDMGPVAARQIVAMPTLSADALPPLDPQSADRPITRAAALDPARRGRDSVVAKGTVAAAPRLILSVRPVAPAQARLAQSSLGQNGRTPASGAATKPGATNPDGEIR